MIASVAASIGSARPLTRSFPASRFNEPSLEDLAPRDRDATAYQLCWNPTFHHPVFVRIDRMGGAVWLYAKVLDGKGGYDPGQVAIERRFPLDAEQWNHLDRLVERAGFWELATRSKADESAIDGVSLVLEGVEEGKYHVVYRSFPEPA